MTNDADQRLEKLLQAAFSGPPTPLKDVPKKNGEPRSLKREASTPSASVAQRARGLKAKIRLHEVDDR
jgi:hypothetical protein